MGLHEERLVVVPMSDLTQWVGDELHDILSRQQQDRAGDGPA